MKFTIIGGGNVGQAAAAYLTSRGGECVINTRDAQKAEIINRIGITAEGVVNGNYRVNVTTDMQKAIIDSDIIIIMTIANAHKEVASRLKPFLTQNQKVLIFNSNWGAFEFKQVLGEAIQLKNLTIAETGAQLFIATSKKPGYVNVNMKSKIYVSAIDSDETQQLLDDLTEYFPQFEKADSIIETTISTTNPVIHVPIALLNAVRIENNQTFLFYGEGVSKGSINLILNLDKERIAVADALGCKIDDVLTVINSFWDIKHDNLFDALTKNSSYIKGNGPTTLNHRYLTEDVPYGIAPISKIGKLFGIETPYTDSLLALIRCVVGTELVDGGISFLKEDFKDYETSVI